MLRPWDAARTLVWPSAPLTRAEALTRQSVAVLSAEGFGGQGGGRSAWPPLLKQQLLGAKEEPEVTAAQAASSESCAENTVLRLVQVLQSTLQSPQVTYILMYVLLRQSLSCAEHRFESMALSFVAAGHTSHAPRTTAPAVPPSRQAQTAQGWGRSTVRALGLLALVPRPFVEAK